MVKNYMAIPFLLMFGLLMCGGGNPVLKLGTGLDEAAREVTGETSAFAAGDVVAFSLSQVKPFRFQNVNARVYRGNDIFEMVRVFDEELPVVMGASSVAKSIPPRDLTAKYGGGNYQVIFMIGEKVIARKNFSVKGQAVQFVPVVKAETEVKTDADGNIPGGEHEKAAE